jgi:hypothetical protein
MKRRRDAQKIDYIGAVQQGRDKEEHNIQVLSESSLDRIKRSIEYWDKMSQEPHREIQDNRAKCEKHWGKISKEMKDIGLLEFDTPDDFTDLRNIVESHAKKDSSWDERLAKVTRHNRHPRTGATIYGTLNQSSG